MSVLDFKMLDSVVLLLLLPLTTLSWASSCECGYRVNSTSSSSSSALFTEILETDFLHLRSWDGSAWLPQNYSMTAVQSHGPFGMLKESRNLVLNDIEDENDWGGEGVRGGRPGLELWVRSEVVQSEDGQFVSTAELVSERDDILYGSFRIAMQTTDIPGTCGAFFFYLNDTEEIDVEILSSEQSQQPNPKEAWPIHLISRSDPKGSSGQLIYNITASAPTENYNEYRFDWFPDRIDFFLNGALIWSTTENIPQAAGRLHISHWSNGNPYWSGGPPGEDAVMRVAYVKGYFNSSDSARNEEYVHGGCADDLEFRGETVCEVPDQTEVPNPFGVDGNETGRTVFLSQRGDKKTNDVSAEKGVASRVRWSCGWIALVVLGWIVCLGI